MKEITDMNGDQLQKGDDVAILATVREGFDSKHGDFGLLEISDKNGDLICMIPMQFSEIKKVERKNWWPDNS